MLAKRKGFVRIALQTGAKLVPVIGFGENDLYDVQEPGPLRVWLTKWAKTLFGFTLPNPSGQGLFWGECCDARCFDTKMCTRLEAQHAACCAATHTALVRPCAGACCGTWSVCIKGIKLHPGHPCC